MHPLFRCCATVRLPMTCTSFARTVLLSLSMTATYANAEAPGGATDAQSAEHSALDLVGKHKPQWWLNVGGFSRHFNRTPDYNESNFGFGVEYRSSPEISYMAGNYRNSHRKNTTYAAVNWQPLSLGPIRVGAAVGVMSGYPAMNRGGAFFRCIAHGHHRGATFWGQRRPHSIHQKHRRGCDHPVQNPGQLKPLDGQRAPNTGLLLCCSPFEFSSLRPQRGFSCPCGPIALTPRLPPCKMVAFSPSCDFALRNCSAFTNPSGTLVPLGSVGSHFRRIHGNSRTQARAFQRP